MKHLFTILTAMCWSVTIMASTGDTIPYYYMGDTLWYEVNDNGVGLIAPCRFEATYNHGYGTHTLPAGIVHVPDSVPVNGIMLPVLWSSNAFTGLQTIDEVYLANPMYSTSYTFDSSSVKKVYLGTSFHTFGNPTFRYCTQLDSVIPSYPDQFVSNMSPATWYQCKAVNNLSKDFLYIGSGVYAYNGSFEDSTLVIPEGVKYIAGYLTARWWPSLAASLRAVTLPSSLVKMDANVFSQGCTGITTVTCLATTPPNAVIASFYNNYDYAARQYTSLCTQSTLYVPWSKDHSILAAYQSAVGWKDFTNILELDPKPEDCDDYTWTATGTILRESQTLGDYTWAIGFAKSEYYVGYNSTRGAQFGSASNPIDTVTLTTHDPEYCLIDDIIVNATMSNDGDAALTVFVGGTQIGCTQYLTNVNTDYTFTNGGKQTGAVELRFSNTIKAIYLKSIHMTMVGNTPTAVVEPELNTPTTLKFIRDGKLYIRTANGEFDATGRMIEK